MKIEEEYQKIIDYCEQLDYSDLEAVFEYADKKVFGHSSELALIIMINCAIKQPKWLDDIMEHTELLLYYEGNKSIYDYILSKYKTITDKDVLCLLDEFLKILEKKYSKVNVKLERD
ncbi:MULTISPECIES: hypothetical protein [unclassified Treponema]|uniref:hypothetical protein n=1 Tax=unclassified Treponema TaxID=2638727 RepID=UPI0020A546FA|nr:MULTISPECIES: hypothetical protein [unclassified Treponema]UTC66579.1 hypothetical protein E4O06_11555 [Treponema sp. OMZ 789]UTC69312.1 hypothetical protein E4O01_11695 [Treponema sp. OMZ 790]UTC72026.1 hypothetical protein E4O02_11790 [Treponema sp. OMZ 791]